MFDSTLMMGGEMFPDEQSRRAALAPLVRYHLPFAALVLHWASLLCIISCGILISVHTLKHDGFYFKAGAPRRAKIKIIY